MQRVPSNAYYCSLYSALTFKLFLEKLQSYNYVDLYRHFFYHIYCNNVSLSHYYMYNEYSRPKICSFNVSIKIREPSVSVCSLQEE